MGKRTCRTCLAFLWFLGMLALGGAAPGVAHAQAGFAAEYTITVEHPETHIMHVDAVFTHPPTPLRLRIWLSGTLTFQIGMSPDETITYPFQVANIEVWDGQGHHVPFTWSPRPGEESYLVISTGRKSEIHLSYDVAVLRPSDVRIGWSYVRAEAFLGPEYGVFIPDDTLFLSPLLDEITLHFRLPKGWRAVAEGEEISPLDYRISTRASFTSPCICGTLSFVAMGPFHVFRKTIAGKEFIVAIQQGQPIPIAEMLDLSARSFAYYTKTFGPYRPSDRFLTIFVNDESSGGCFHGFLFSPRAGNSTLHNYAGHPLSCYPFWNNMIADEMIYLWTDQLGVYGNPHTSASWLIQSMGVTYYRLTVKLGYATEAQYYARMLSDWEVYQDDLRSAGLTNAQVVLATTDSPLIVGKAGLVTGMLREKIVEATHGEKDFDDLLKMVIVPNPTGFTNQDILRALKTLTGKDFSDFFQKYVYGTADLKKDWIEEKYRQAQKTDGGTPHPDPRKGLKGWSIVWNHAQILPDGDDAEWPQHLSPAAVVGRQIAVYAFSDAHYIYLKIAPLDSFQGKKLLLSLLDKDTGKLWGLYLDPATPSYLTIANGNQTYLPLVPPSGNVWEIVLPRETIGTQSKNFQILGRFSDTASPATFVTQMPRPSPTPTLTLTPTSTATPTLIPLLSSPSPTPHQNLRSISSQPGQNVTASPSFPLWVGVVLAFVVGVFLGRQLKRR